MPSTFPQPESEQDFGSDDLSTYILARSQASRDIDNPLHAIIVLDEIIGYAKGSRRALLNGGLPSDERFKHCTRLMYTYLVKLEMWRQHQTGDYRKIRLFKHRRENEHKEIINGY